MVGDIHMYNLSIPNVQLLILANQLKGVVDVTQTDVNGHFPSVLFLQREQF